MKSDMMWGVGVWKKWEADQITEQLTFLYM